jgi:hypothetical protein
MPSLDSTTYVANNGVNEQKTMREVIAMGGGRTYDILSTKPYWNDLMAAYVAEQTNPQKVLEKKVYKAYAAMKSAEWWFNFGMSEVVGDLELDEFGEVNPTPPEGRFNDAHDAWAAAATHYDELKDQLKQLKERLSYDWEDLYEKCGFPVKPEGTVLVAIPDSKSAVVLPLFPWPQVEEVREVTTPMTAHEDTTLEAANPVTYPQQTKLTAAFILADKPGLHKVKAVVTKDGVLQLTPKEIFDSVESWVSSLPYVVGGNITVTLPKRTAGLKQRIRAFAESIDSKRDLTLGQKISAIYEEFRLKSFVTLGSETHDVDWSDDIDWSTCTSVTPIMWNDRVIGRFVRYSDLELVIVNKTKETICPTSDTLCVGGKMLDNLEDFRCGNNLIFQLYWKTPKGRRHAVFSLKYTA